MKCKTCGRFMKRCGGHWSCKVHGCNEKANFQIHLDPVQTLSSIECMDLLANKKVVEVWIAYTTNMARSGSEGQWMKTNNKTIYEFEKSIRQGLKYRQRPESKLVETPKPQPVPVEKKTLDNMTSAELEIRMTEAAEVMMKFGTSTKLASGNTLIMIAKM